MSASATLEKAEETKPAGSMAGKLMIAGFLAGVVAVECLLAYLLIPSAEEVAELAEQKMAQRLPANLGDGELVGLEDEKPAVEIELGDYSVTVSRPNASTTIRVDFQLVGTALDSEAEEVKALFDRHIHRFRDQILFEIRNSDPADLADPGLGLIKRRILEKSNALFGKPILRSVVFSQFSYVEQ
jgi:flagellar FliL protein